jgi:hypothetical protein
MQQTLLRAAFAPGKSEVFQLIPCGPKVNCGQVKLKQKYSCNRRPGLEFHSQIEWSNAPTTDRVLTELRKFLNTVQFGSFYVAAELRADAALEISVYLLRLCFCRITHVERAKE